MTIKLNKNTVLGVILVSFIILSLVMGVNVLLKNTEYQVSPWEEVSVIYELDDETQMEVTDILKIVHYETIQRVDIYYYNSMTSEYTKTSLKTWQIQYISSKNSVHSFTYILRGE